MKQQIVVLQCIHFFFFFFCIFVFLMKLDFITIEFYRINNANLKAFLIQQRDDYWQLLTTKRWLSNKEMKLDYCNVLVNLVVKSKALKVVVLSISIKVAISQDIILVKTFQFFLGLWKTVLFLCSYLTMS